jgi:hypothetical protein
MWTSCKKGGRERPSFEWKKNFIYHWRRNIYPV